MLVAVGWLLLSGSGKKPLMLQSTSEILPEQPGAAWHWLVPLILLIVAGGALRLVALGENSLNHMEVYIPGIPLPPGISVPPPRHDWFSALTWGFFKEPHPVGYFLAMFAWTKLFGTGVAALRLPAALLGTLSIPVLYRVGKLAYDWKVGLIAAGFLALHGFHIHTSMWARMFVPECFLGLVSTWLLLEILRSKRHRGLLEALYVLVALVGFNIEWFFWPLIGTHFLFALLHYKKDGETHRLLYLQVLAMILGAYTLSQVAATAGLAASGTRASAAIVREYFSFGIFYNEGLSELHPHTWPLPVVLATFVLSVGLLWRSFRVVPVRAYKPDSAPSPGWQPLFAAAAGMTMVMASIVPVATTLIAKTKYMPLVAAIVVFPAIAFAAFPIATWLGPKVRARIDRMEMRSPLVGILRSPIALLALFPFLMVSVGAIARPMVDRQALIMFIPYLLVLIAAGTREAARHRLLAAPLAIVLVLSFAASAWHFRGMPQSNRDYATLSKQISARMGKNDVVFVLPLKYYVTPFFYYMDPSRLVSEKYDKYSRKSHARIWIVLFEDEQPADNISNALAGLVLADRVDVLGAHGLLYERL